MPRRIGPKRSVLEMLSVKRHGPTKSGYRICLNMALGQWLAYRVA